MKFIPVQYRLATAVLLGTLGLLSACSSTPTDPRIKFNEQLDEDLGTAYKTPRQQVTGWAADWDLAGQSVEVALQAPATAGPVPLIIYLPGLGEAATAGEQWRRAWAQAGYAVLSVQDQNDGPDIYASGLALAGDFHSLAAYRYADSALQRRLVTVQKVISEARSRAAKGDAQLAAIDWNQVVFAGFDLGAQTAVAMAMNPAAVQVQPKALLLLSPYAEAGADPAQFAKVTVPVLSLTGQNDEDPFNWVNTYHLRQVVGDSVNVAGSYQVDLNRATHKTLSGTELVSAPKPDSKTARLPEATDSGSKQAHGGGKGRSRGAPSRGANGPSAGEPPTDPKQVAAIQAISLAFLDSQLKRAPGAADWLHRGATGWLGDAGRLKEKVGR